MVRPKGDNSRRSVAGRDPIVWKVIVGVAVLVLWTGIYFTASLQNQWPFGRTTVLALTPEILLASIVEQPDESLPSGWQYLPQRFDLIATAVFVLLGASALGDLLLRGIKIDLQGLSRTERVVFAGGIGLSVWSLLTLASGLAGWLSRPLFGAVLSAAMIAELILLWGERKARESSLRKEHEEWKRGLLAIGLLVTLPFLLAAALGAMLPPVDFDVKEYHLGGPKEWFLDGYVHFLPHNVYTSFPFLTEMLSLSAMVLQNDWYRGALAGQLILAGFLPLTALAVFALGRRLFGVTAGVLGALVYVTTPWAYRIAVIAYAEGGLAFYVALSVLAAVVAMRQIQRGEPGLRSTLLTGIFAGSGMACKYPGILQAVIPIGGGLLAWSVLHYRRNQANAMQTRSGEDGPDLAAVGSVKPAKAAVFRGVGTLIVVYGLGVLIAVGPWLMKNWVETGNPVYPLLWSVFGGRDWGAALNAQWRAAHSSSNYQVMTFFRDLADLAVRSNWQSLLVFGFAPFALFRRGSKEVWVLWGFAAYLVGAWWLLTHRIDRFWLPLLPVVAVLAGAGVTWIEGSRHGADSGSTATRSVLIWRSVAGTVFAVATVFNLSVVTSGLSGPPNYLADLDAAARVVQTPNLALLNEMLPADAKVLLVGEAEIFDARFTVIYNTVFDRNIFQEWTADPRPGLPEDDWPLRSTPEIDGIFAEQGVTHLYVNWREIVRYRTTYGFTPFVTPERFRELQDRGVLGDATTLRQLPLEAIEETSQQREIQNRFGSLIRKGRGSDAFIAAELYPVIAR